MRRTGVALIVAAFAILLLPTTGLAKKDPDGQYRSDPEGTTITLNRDGRMISQFGSDVQTSCPVGNSQLSTVFVHTNGKANISVSRKGRFSASIPYIDVQGFPNSGIAAVSGKLKGKLITGHIEASDPNCSFASDYAVTLRRRF